jgi:hypothetical protein
VRQALQALPWVGTIAIDLENRFVYLGVDPSRYDRAALLEAMARAGYPAHIVSEGT